MRFLLCLLAAQAPLADLTALRNALQAGRYKDAENIADTMLRTQNGDAFLWTAKALALGGQQRTADAVKSLDRALQLRPDFLPALKAGAEITYKARDSRSRRFLALLLKVDPGNETAHAMSAVLAVEERKCEVAIQHFDRAAAAIRGDVQAMNQYGYCLMSAGRPQSAIPVYLELLQKRPSSRTIRYNLALAQSEAKQTAKALATLADVEDVEALNLRASIEAGEGHVERAIATLRVAVKLAPRDERNYIDLAALCVEHGNAALAEEIISTGLSHAPGSARLYSIRGIVRVLQAQYDSAAADFEKASKLLPEEPYAAVGMTVLLRQQNQTADMVEVVRSRLKRSPSDWMLNYLLAEALVREGAEPGQPAFTEAVAALNRSIQSNRGFGGSYASLGKLYLRNNQTEAALKQLQKAVELDPANRTALNQMLICLRRLNRTDEAKQVSAQLAALLQEELRKDVRKQRLLIAKVE